MVGVYYSPIEYFLVITAGIFLMMWIDLGFGILQDRYTEFLREQKNEKI